MKRNYRKCAALALSLTLAMCAPISAAADESGQTDPAVADKSGQIGSAAADGTAQAGSAGSGQRAGINKQDVYQVLLPTDVNGVFDFMIDPQKLIEETNAAAYGGKSFEKGATVFFHRMDGRSAEEYSSSSDQMTITNRSTVPVEIMVDVSVSPDSLGGITMTGDRTFAGDTGASLYMALTDGENTVPVGTGDSWIRTTIPAAPEEAFEYSYDQERGEYNRGLKQDLNGIQFPEYSFRLVGAANEKGDWAALGKAAPRINVTWKVTPGQSLNSGGEKDADETMDVERSDILTQILETEPVDRESADGNAAQGSGPSKQEPGDDGNADQGSEASKREPGDGNAAQGSKPSEREPADGGEGTGRVPAQDEAADSNGEPAQNGNADAGSESALNRNAESDTEPPKSENTDLDREPVRN